MERSSSESKSSDLFSHTTLPDPSSYIRLLRLLPPIRLTPTEGFAEEVNCSIHETPIAAAPRYKALSYCWGKPEKTHSVLVDGKLLPITSSLDTALRHLRHPAEPIVIWIDQICIDQDDASGEDEKNAQVRMMGDIYSNAEQVLIWLGPAEQGSDEVMDLYAEVGKGILKAGLQEYCGRDRFPVLADAVARKHPGDSLWRRFNAAMTLGMNEWLMCLEAMAHWDKRKWFSRVWVIQELCFGPNPVFVCGHKRVPIEFVKSTRLFLPLCLTTDFLDTARSLGVVELVNNKDPTPSFFSIRDWRRRYDTGGGPGDTLLELLRKVYVGRMAEASRPEDRIFSLLNIATDTTRLGIDVDYGRDSTQLFIAVTKAIITGTGNLDVLSYAQFPKDLSLPTWVPDWHSNLRPSFYYYPPVGFENEHVFQPTGGCPPLVVPVTHDAILGLGGFVVDTIEEVGSVWTDETADPLRHQSYLAQIRFLCRLSAMKNQPIYPSRQRRDEAEWRIPIADIWETRESSERQRAGERAMRAFVAFHMMMNWFTLREMGTAGGASLTAPDDYEASMYRLSMAKLSRMRPFMTSLGYVGLGPSVITPGDSVVALYGARVCSVLRPRAVQVKEYQYLGEAYCDGVMNGELVGRRLQDVFYLV